MEYFKCNPSLCYGASCCRNQFIKPVTSLGDLLRLSKHTGRSPSEIWEQDGEVALVPTEKRGEFESFAALKVPCPFLKDNKCTVYSSRPFGCAVFPLEAIFEGKKELELYDKGEFRCLNGTTLSPKDAEVLEKMRYVMKKEVKIEIPLFPWTQERTIDATTNIKVHNLIKAAVEKQQKVDATASTERSKHLISSAGRLNQIIREKQGVQMDDFRALIEPIADILHRDIIKRIITSLTPEQIARYDNTSARYLELIGELASNNSPCQHNP